MLDRLKHIEVEDLLKIVLILVIIWLALEVIGFFVRITLGTFRFVQPLIGVILVVLLLLWLVKRV